jgi:3alpha(or 20beta)-hydroxysteroid dehydrogenase
MGSGMVLLSADFSDRVVVITGAGSGMGKAAAEILADTTARLILVDVNEAAVSQVASGIKGARSFAVDVRDAAQVEECVRTVAADHGRIDAFFNNAGILGHHGPLIDSTVLDYDRVFNVNVRGSYLCLAAVLRVMVARKSGTIVNTASIAGLRGVANTTLYAASKSAVIGMTRSVAREVGPHGVRVNAICPGATATGFSDMSDAMVESICATVPLGRLATAEDMARTALWLMSDAASFLNGVIVPVDGGQTA